MCTSLEAYIGTHMWGACRPACVACVRACARAGGQVGDTGALAAGAGSVEVRDTQVAAGFVLHVVDAVPGAVAVGEVAAAQVDYARRGLIMPNHTFTHVLNFGLK